MRTVQLTLDDKLVREVDRVAKEMRQTRSAFARAALRDALHKVRVARLERRHFEGYRAHPPPKSEFGVWEKEQAWGEE